MVLIGIDPAVAKRTAVAVVIEDSVHLLMVNTFDPGDLVDQLTKLNIPQDEKIHLTIEAQKIYRGSKVKTQTLLELANRGGFFEAIILSFFPNNPITIHRPLPQEWKGQVPADMYRKRILKKYPIVAKGTVGMSKQEQEDACHAYGLAIFKK